MKREIEPGHTVAPMPSRFRKKPVVVEAHQWFKNGDHPQDYAQALGGDNLLISPEFQRENNFEGQVVRYYRHPAMAQSDTCKHCGGRLHKHGWIDTLEGGHIVCPGDWIITGVKGEHYPCKPDVFAQTYEPVSEDK